jgi:hypothetical protein
MFQFNMGKKFGGYSWLRSADSTRRRLEYFLANKWQRDGEMLGRVSCEDTTFCILGTSAAARLLEFAVNWGRSTRPKYRNHEYRT